MVSVVFQLNLLLEQSEGDALTGSHLGAPGTGQGLGVVEVSMLPADTQPGTTAHGCWSPDCHSLCHCLSLMGIRSVHSALGREDLHFHLAFRLEKGQVS